MKLHLIDGSAYFFRAYFALPPFTRSFDGFPCGAIHGFCQMLWQLTAAPGHTHIAVVFDGGRSGRDQIDPNYKANRAPRPEDLTKQLPHMDRAAEAHGVASIRVRGFEADDLIASYARATVAAGGECVVYSSDKDLMQLLGTGIQLYDPMKQQHLGPDDCVAKFGVRPDQLSDYLALVGDAADNVPGCPGIGKKTAAELLREFGTLDGVLKAAMAYGSPMKARTRELLLLGAQEARRSRQLVVLQENVALPIPLAGLERRAPSLDRLLNFYGEFEFMQLADQARGAAMFAEDAA